MKIVFLSIWFSEGMGYAENCLPKSLAKLGHEVHVISSVCQVYYNQPYYDSVYRNFLGDPIKKPGIKELDGYTLHLLPFGTIFNKIYLKKLSEEIKTINPDIVQTFDAFSFLTLQATLLKFTNSYKLFTANHVVASIFPLMQEKRGNIFYWVANLFMRYIPGKLVSLSSSRCYPATSDAIEVAVKYYGVPRKKTKLACLGVDTDKFIPVNDDQKYIDERARNRNDLGIDKETILCIYTGRFTNAKNPLILAQAINILNQKQLNYKGLFLGEGPQAEDIRLMEGCLIKPFVMYNYLAEFYRIADIGIWPQQESTSMLDASASGLPIIVSNRVQALERIEGNGITYNEGDVNSMVESLKKLSDKDFRKKLGEAGTKKILEKYSWDKIARERVEDYEYFISSDK